MRFDIVTTFPEMFSGIFDASVIGRAVHDGKLEIHIHNLRSWTDDKHRVTDDYTYGGGPGMLMKVEPFAKAVDDLREKNRGAKVALMTPQGDLLTQKTAIQLSTKLPGLIILCGRYEGVDERVRENYCDLEISIGDYVLTGGEIPAMALVDTVARLVPGVLGDSQSALDESHLNSLLEYPQYTRPAEFKGLKVPEVLLSGNHADIENWRREQSVLRTAKKRPDLLSGADLTEKERELAEKAINNAKDETDGRA
ncbi:tRNA (guanine(37)-N(1))-methyltransferase [hydrothermal vent metagenome]|uniref:tRNA (guanine-N(1)-)-methyltransferase n=1 Tax=hydrothermal vent metagenome TaxID=652676 RepID=A0A3B1CGF7_9ZZZZ